VSQPVSAEKFDAAGARPTLLKRSCKSRMAAGDYSTSERAKARRLQAESMSSIRPNTGDHPRWTCDISTHTSDVFPARLCVVQRSPNVASANPGEQTYVKWFFYNRSNVTVMQHCLHQSAQQLLAVRPKIRPSTQHRSGQFPETTINTKLIPYWNHNVSLQPKLTLAGF